MLLFYYSTKNWYGAKESRFRIYNTFLIRKSVMKEVPIEEVDANQAKTIIEDPTIVEG